jgi:hypothetical protein
MRHYAERALSIPRAVFGFTQLFALDKALDRRLDTGHYPTCEHGLAGGVYNRYSPRRHSCTSK